jgi:hypothetical protein
MIDDEHENVRALMSLHRDALTRVLELAPDAKGAFAADPAISSALALHGLHPIDAEKRVRDAVARVAGAELLSIEGNVATVKVERAADEKIVDELVCGAAPEVDLKFERVDVPLDRLRKHARCDLCSERIGDAHDHTIDPKTRKLECACDTCARLFDMSTHKRRVKQRSERLTLSVTDEAWDALAVPIDVAFFHRSSVASRVVAAYPGPAGATESALSLDAWRELAAENPVLDALEPDVEALLVNRRQGARDYFRVSIDRCYELVGVMRREWRGFSGGSEVWTAMSAFFATLEAP